MATDEATSRTTDVSPVRPATPAERRAQEHAGTTDTSVLADDIAKTREELAVTIDAIVDRVSPKKVVERGKQQARENVQEATVVVKGHAATAATVAREKALAASEVVKEKAAQVKEKVSGSSDSEPVRSPLAPATSVSLSAATPVTATPATTATGTTAASPLPANTVSVDAGEVPPPEAVDSPGALAEAADARAATPEPAGSELPSYRPVPSSSSSEVPPAYAGAGAAAVLGLLLLLLRRRRRNRRRTLARRR